MIELPYGRVPYPLELGTPVTVLEPAPRPAPRALPVLLEEALASPIDRPTLGRLAGPASRVTVIVSDATRSEPRRAFIEAIVRQLPTARWTLAIATGTHGPSPLAALDLPLELLSGARVVNHDGHRGDDLVDLGLTPRGTPVRIHRCAVEADLVIATGCIRPHYFAGFGAGVKAIFPGLGEARAIRVNHLLKTAPGARAGVVEGNPCRDDLEDAARLLPTPTFLLNGVAGPDGAIHAAVAGDPVRAFRAGADLAGGWYRVAAPRSGLVIASDALPVSSSLYQAAKIAAAAAPLVRPGGTLLLVAECAGGIEPLQTVNEAIFRIGVLPRLAPGVALKLVSSLDAASVGRTLLGHAASVREVVDAYDPRLGPVLVVPRASQLLLEPIS